MAGKVVAVRLSEEELKKLDLLAEKTQRDRSKVLRLLIAQAYTYPLPDIRVVAPREFVGEAEDDA